MRPLSLSPPQCALALCLVVTLAVCVRPMADFMQSLGDTDDAMRLVQTRALLHGRGWWDLIEPRLAPPAGLAVHWSRLVDAPIAVLLGLFSAMFGPQWGETIARALWPVLLFAPSAWLWIKIAQRMGGEISMWAAATMTPLCFTVWQQFAPGRLDHHNVQLLLMAVLMFAALDAQRPRSAAVMGAACALSVAVGFEALPVIVWAAGLIALRYVWSTENAPAAFAFGATLAGAGALAFMVQTPPAWWLRTGCDALAFNGAAAAAAAGVVMAGVAKLAPGKMALRFAGVGAAGLAGAALFVALHPSCLQGPYADLDPRLGPIWLDRVGEARSFAEVLSKQTVLGVAGGLLPLGALIAAGIAIARGRRDAPFIALTGLLALTVLVGLIQARGMVLAAAAAIPLAAVQLAQLLGVTIVRPLVAGLALGLLASPTVTMFVAQSLAPPAMITREQTATLNQDACFRTAAFADLATLKPGLVFADLDAGPHILAHTAHSAWAAPYHRLGQPIYDAMTVFYEPLDRAAPVIARTGADYIAICRDGAFAQQIKSGSFAEALLKGGAPDWLKPLPGAEGGYSLFQVDHAALAGLGALAQSEKIAPPGG